MKQNCETIEIIPSREIKGYKIQGQATCVFVKCQIDRLMEQDEWIFAHQIADKQFNCVQCAFKGLLNVSNTYFKFQSSNQLTRLYIYTISMHN